MATEAATGQPANVQAYLNKHSIATLFEDLTALLVKDLPDNPLDFLILKLQAKKKKATASITSGRTSGGKKLDVTGTAATKTERTKPPGKPTTVKSSTASAGSTKTTRPTTGTTTSRPTKPTTTTTKERSTKSAPTSTRPTTSRPTTTKTTVKPTASSSGIKKPTTTAKSTSTKPTSTTTPRKPVGKTTTGIPTKSGGTPKTATSSGGSRTPSDTNSPSITRKAGPKTVTKVTEPTPPTRSVAKSSSKDEEEEEEIKVDKNKVTVHDNNDSEEEEEDRTQSKETSVDLNQLITQVKRSKHPRKQTQDKTHLAVLINAHQTALPISEGYISDNEEENEGLEVVESAAALEEEGVVLTEEAKKLSLKLPSAGPAVDLQVRICARCAKIIANDEESTLISSSKLTSIDEFESASQVAASTTSQSQWDTEESGSMTIKQKWAAPPPPPTTTTNDNESTSVSSGDTWKGIAPVSRDVVPSNEDDESELTLPPSVDYHKPEETTTEAEESTLIED